MIVVKTDFTGEYLGNMGNFRLIKTTQSAGVGRFRLTVGAVTGYNNCSCLFHALVPVSVSIGDYATM